MITVRLARALASRGGWLSQTPASFQQSVLDRCFLKIFKPDEIIYSIGDPPGGLYGLASGSLRVSLASGGNGPYFAHLLQPAMWIGEGPAISGQPRLVALSAGIKSTVLHLPLSAVHEIVGKNPEAWRYFAGLALVNLATALDAITDLMMRDDLRRLVAVLLRLAGARSTTPPGPEPLEIQVSQGDIASTANLARTTAGAMLRKLEASGHIQLIYRRVVLLRPDGLRSMVEE